jgi:hypothetical protein
MAIRKNIIIEKSIKHFLLFIILNIVASLACLSCYAQNSGSDSLVDDDASFNYYKIIEQRNFFRPKVEPKPAETDLAEKPKTLEKDNLDFILTGVIEIRNGYKAIVEQISTKKGFYVAVNEAIADYTVKTITPNKIVIEKNNQEFELKLQQGSKPNPPDTPVAVPETDATQQTNTEEDAAIPQTLRSNTIQQIRSGTRGTK